MSCKIDARLGSLAISSHLRRGTASGQPFNISSRFLRPIAGFRSPRRSELCSGFWIRHDKNVKAVPRAGSNLPIARSSLKLMSLSYSFSLR
jgi:hypothetical protein